MRVVDAAKKPCLARVVAGGRLFRHRHMIGHRWSREPTATGTRGTTSSPHRFFVDCGGGGLLKCGDSREEDLAYYNQWSTHLASCINAKPFTLRAARVRDFRNQDEEGKYYAPLPGRGG